MGFDIDPQLILILVGFGFLAAFIDSVVGGGGLISLPALMFSGLSPSAAVATNKLASSMGSLTSTIAFYRSGKLDLKSVSKFVPFVFICSIIGAWIVHLLDPNLLKPLMLIMLAVVAVYTILKKDWGGISGVKKLSKPKYIFFFIIIAFIGFYDGFLGPGTGSFLIFAFLMVGYDFLKAAGNAKLLNLTSNLGALLMFLYLGQVNFMYGIIMGLSQIVGAAVGSRFALKRGSGYVRVLFIIVTFTLLAKNTYDYFF